MFPRRFTWVFEVKEWFSIEAHLKVWYSRRMGQAFAARERKRTSPRLDYGIIDVINLSKTGFSIPI